MLYVVIRHYNTVTKSSERKNQSVQVSVVQLSPCICLRTHQASAGRQTYAGSASINSAIMNTTQKHRDFVDEPMGDKLVTALAGIGDILGAKLRHNGLKYAYNVVGQYLVLNKDEVKFKEWLCKNCPADAGERNLCFNCVKGWCDAHA